MKSAIFTLTVPIAAFAALVGCSVPGEEAERAALESEGRAYRIPYTARMLPVLAKDAPLPDLLQYAFLSNASL